MAAIVAAVIGERIPAGHFALLVTPLGGAAAQYIAQDHSANTWRNPANRTRVTPGDQQITFGAYAFNAIGLDSMSAGRADPATLQSYYIHGDIVSWLGVQLGQVQAGTVLQYRPPTTWPRVGVLQFADSILTWSEPETLRRHRLPAVKQALCECMNGRGVIE